MERKKERRQSLHHGIRMKRIKSTRRKITRKSKRGNSNTFQNTFAPVCGLFVFVGLVAYRNYLLSANDSAAVLLHHYKRQAPDEPRGIVSRITSIDRLRSHPKHKNKQGVLSKVQIPTPSPKNKKLASMQMKRRFEDRRKLLLEKCEGSLKANWDDSLQLIAAPEQNVTVCIVQKAGSTSWHKLIYKLRTGQPWVKAGHQSNRQASIDMPEETKLHLTQSNYAKRIITVRHPFSRIISGWHNKFYKDFAKKDFFINKLGPYAGRHKPEENHVIAFRDLVEYIADEGLENIDVHFKSIEQLCKPCQFPYEYIVRAETVLDDLWFVLDKINSTMDSFNKHSIETLKNSKGLLDQTPWEKDKETIKYFFKSIPRDTVEKLTNLYADDLEKFGYTFDPSTNLIGDIID